MSDNQSLQQEKNDDLDLFQLLRQGIIFLRTYRLLLLITALIGAGCGYILYRSMPRNFSAQLLLESRFLNNMEQSAVVRDWNMTLSDNTRYILVRKFGCAPEVVASLRNIRTETLPALSDGTICSSLIVQVRDTSLLDELQKGLVNGFNNNEYVRKRVTLLRDDLQRQITKAEEEMNRLDSTKRYVDYISGDGRRGNTQLILDVSGVSKDKVEIGSKLAGLKEKLLLAEGVSVVEGFSIPTRSLPSLLIFLMVGLAGGFFVGYFLAMFKSVMQTLPKHKTN